jgi:predicted membrane-bound spermidine synthase
VHCRLFGEDSPQPDADLAGAPALFKVLPDEVPQLRFAGDLPGALAAPSAFSAALGRPRTVVARGFVNVASKFPAHG